MGARIVRPLAARTALTGAVLAACLLGAGSAHAGSIGGFGAFPALAHPGDTRLPYFSLRARVGRSQLIDAVAVNSSARTVSLDVVPVAGLTGQTSGAVYGNAERHTTDGLTLDPQTSRLTLAPHSRRRVPIRVTVGPGARAGDHLAGVAFVDRHHPHGGGNFAVTEVIRVVIGVAVRVPGHASAGVRVGRLSAIKLGGTPDAAVDVPITNTGGVYCRPHLSVVLRGGGRHVAQERTLDTILPGQTISFPLPWRHALQRGTYTAAVAATGCGTAHRHVQALVVHTSRPAALPGAKAPSPAPERTGGSSPWLLLVAVGAGGLLLGVVVSRRRRTPPTLPPEAPQSA